MIINKNYVQKGRIFCVMVVVSLFFNIKYNQAQTAISPPTVSIIPQPVSVQYIGNNPYRINHDTQILIPKDDSEMQRIANYLQQELKARLNVSFAITLFAIPNQFNIIELQKDERYNNEPEGYVIISNAQKVNIISGTGKGLFYGIQSLLQLIPADAKLVDANASVVVPNIKIKDYPRFTYRGMHLDVCRHFFPIEFIKKYIDLIALHKMNTFHWHLTDDQGWRIEIKKYPLLTSIGSCRNETLVGHFGVNNPPIYDGKPYCGFYTQEQIKEVVAYAEERYVTVIPEIEMPGHSLAALSAYPRYACTEGPFSAATTWGVFDDVFCPKENTFIFLEDILSEVCELFPNTPYIHIGGDECPKTRWKESAYCQQLIKERELKDEHGLQSYFVQRIEKFVNSKGKSIIGWDEILEGGLAPNATVMSWRGTEGGIAAVKQKHYVIMTPGSHCYFDHYQAKPTESEPMAIGGFTNVEKVYNFEPVPAELDASEEYFILGAQGNMWTEYIPTIEQIEYMVLPRMSALAEVNWTPKTLRDYESFVNRMYFFRAYLDRKNINYAKHIFNNK